MLAYLQALSDFYRQELGETVLQNHLAWPQSFDALQERLGEANLLALSQAFSQEGLLHHLNRHQLPILLVRRDWKEFYLAIPTGKKKKDWYLWRQERFLGSFSPEAVLQKGLGEDAYMYLVVPRGFVPSPFSSQPLPPWKRLGRFFSAESRIVAYIYTYAILAGGTNLLIPVLVQAIFTYIQTLVWATGLTTLLLLSLAVLVASAVVRIGQYILIEHLQRRLFLHSTLEIVHHVPRWLYPAVVRENLPSLINRYFEIFTLEKNLSKLLLNVPADLLTILLAIILLSFYAPFFALSVVLLTGIVTLGIAYTFKPAYHKKKAVSDEKYTMATWLEELARALLTFKVAGFPPLLYRRTQELETRYLTRRQQYFRLLLTQKGLLYFYQIAIALTMLSLGALLVVDKQISLGQFVASELVLFLILNAVQDLVGNLDSLYDALVGIEKLSQIFQPPTEKIAGVTLPAGPFSLSLQGVGFTSHHSGAEFRILHNLNLQIKAGEKVCLTGPAGGGKTTLLHVLYGLYTNYGGDIYVSGINLRQTDLLHYRARIGDALEVGEIIDATVWDNLTLSAGEVSWEEVLAICDRLGFRHTIEQLPEGFFTRVPPGGRGLLSGLIQRKLILARALLSKPDLLIVDDLFATVDWSLKEPICQVMLDPQASYTAIIVSQDPKVMQMCDRVAFLYEGQIRYSGAYEGLQPYLKSQNLSLSR